MSVSNEVNQTKQRLAANDQAAGGHLKPFNPTFNPTRNDKTGRECTDYAREYVKDMSPHQPVPSWTKGNAQDWLPQAPPGQKYTSSGKAADEAALKAAPVGSLVIWNGYDGYGHVGVITKNQNGQVEISEGNRDGKGGQVNTTSKPAAGWESRISPSSDRNKDLTFAGIIYPGSQ